MTYPNRHDHPEFVCCLCPAVPAALALEAAWQATVLRPGNHPTLAALAVVHPRDEPLPPEALTGLRAKFWPNGYQVRMAFLGGNTRTNDRVLEYANHWHQYANVSFVGVGPADRPDVLVGYGQPGYWSYIGTDSRVLARQGRPTLNLQGFDRDGVPDKEWFRVAEHETGHALGLIHEQVRFAEKIDRAAAYAYFGHTQGWTPAMVEAQVLAGPPAAASLVESPEPDAISIMEYALPAEIMRDRQPVAGGGRISAVDIATIGRIYPGRGPVHPGLPGVGT